MDGILDILGPIKVFPDTLNDVTLFVGK